MLWCSLSFGSITTPLQLRINHKFTTNHVNSVKNIVFVTQNLENHNKLELRKSVIFLYFGAILQISKNVGSAKRKPGPRKKNIFLLKISPHFKRERERERKRDWFSQKTKTFWFLKLFRYGQRGSQPGELTHFLFMCNSIFFLSIFMYMYMHVYMCIWWKIWFWRVIRSGFWIWDLGFLAYPFVWLVRKLIIHLVLMVLTKKIIGNLM